MPSKHRPLLVAAISGRALAQAARRAGYAPRVADLFGDADTIDAAERFERLPGTLSEGFDPPALLACLHRLAGSGRRPPVILGSGFERQPDLIDAVARDFPLEGCSGTAIARLKDPFCFAADCAALDIPHPPVTDRRPSDPVLWLSKRRGGAGGVHVRHAAIERGTEVYFQRRLPGDSVSALFLGGEFGARIVGFSRQWTAPGDDAPYRYGGAVRLRRFGMSAAMAARGWLNGLSRRLGLKGLCSADFLLDRGRLTLLEVNPRPGATLDIFDSDEAPLLAAHIAACRNEPFALPRYPDSAASAILYATRPVDPFPVVDWPDWIADRQRSGTAVNTGDPVCTAIVRGPNAWTARRRLESRTRRLARIWETNAIGRTVPC